MRRLILESLFYNTGSATYVELMDNHKKADRRGKVPLIDARRMRAKMSKSLCNKCVQMTDEQSAELVQTYSGNADDATFKNEFVEGYRDAKCLPVSAALTKASEKRPATRYVGRKSRSLARRHRHTETKTSRLISMCVARNLGGAYVSAFVGVLGRCAPAGRRLESVRAPSVVQLVRRVQA